MTSTLTVSDVALAEPSSLFNTRSHSEFRSNTPSPSLQSQGELGQEPNQAQNGRKRRRAAHLTRIAIGKLSTSNESLNSNSGSGSGSDDDTQLTSSAGDEDSQNQLWGQESGQKRFCSSSQGVKSLPSSQSSVQAPVEDCGGDDLAVVECSQSGSTSVKALAVASGGLLLNGTYEIVGNARECEAVNIHDKTIFHCLIMKPEEHQKFLTVLERLKVAEKTYDDEEEFSRLKNLLVPEETLTIFGENGNWYVLLPHHQGNLHSMLRSTSSDPSVTSNKICSERRVQPIFKQIVALVDFCHRIGIYFRDFRLRKFVFVDKEKTRIRLNNVLDLWVAPEIGDDQINQRYKSQVCPVYVAPEIFDMSRSYAGQPADVWGLGVLMFSLLMGRFPFHDPNPTALFKRIKARRFSCPIDERISSSARWLLHGLLRPLASDRPSAAEILQWHWLNVDSSFLPDGREVSAVYAKNGGGLTMNPQQLVFSSSTASLAPAVSRSLSASGPAVQNSEVVTRQGSPPAFVRLSQTGNGSAVGAMGPPLQQVALQQLTAIHVRLALVSPRPSPQAVQNRDTVIGSPLPHPLTHSTIEEVLDQLVPELGKERQSVPSAASLAENGLALTVSDHYYNRGPNGAAVLSVQSFPPTGMTSSARPLTSVSRNPVDNAAPSS